MRWHFIHEMLMANQIEIRHVVGDDNPADLLTKPMGGLRFRRLRKMILNEEEIEENESD